MFIHFQLIRADFHPAKMMELVIQPPSDRLSVPVIVATPAMTAVKVC